MKESVLLIYVLDGKSGATQLLCAICAIALEQGGAIYHVVCKFSVVSVLYI
jgi:hypothetical protein